MYTFENFSELTISLTKKNFLEKFKKPILLIEKREASEITETNKQLAFNTIKSPNSIKNEDFLGAKNQIPPMRNSVVYNFDNGEEKYYIGRTKENEILLKDPNVSKVHAYFQEKKIKKGIFFPKFLIDWFIVDIDSKSGTFVNGEYLRHKEKFKLKSGTAIQFGPLYFCTFFLAENCYEYIMSMPKYK